MSETVSTADCLELVQAMVQIQRGFGARLAPMLGEHGLDMRLFILIKRIESGCIHPGALAKGSMETPSQITRQLDKLESLGFATRTLDAEDSRRIRMDVTDKARALFIGIDTALAAQLVPAFATLDPEARRGLIAGLSELAANLRAEAEL